MTLTHLYHLSHIDLDGYGCHYLTHQCFEHITAYNANYGPEVTARLEEIIEQIKQDRNNSEGEYHPWILITDLNLTPKEAKWIEQEAIAVRASLQLLDHHATGAHAAERFGWYTLDTSRCATLITYDWLRRNHGFDPEGSCHSIVQAINAIDIWLHQDPLFEFGKVCLGMISGAKEINRILFPAQDRAFKSHLIALAQSLIDEHEAHIRLDDQLHSFKKSFFIQKHNDTKDNLVAQYVTRLLTADKERLTISYRTFKGLLGYNVGSSSLIGNAFLLANPDYDFYMDVSHRGRFSLRSNDKLDVSRMAAQVGNGGGHPNASGGKIEHFKDSFVYETLRSSIQAIINEKST
jgi:uncharacterized protein